MYNEMMDTIGLVNTVDPELAAAMDRELNRQRQNIELIASENIVSPAVMAAMGSILTNKYAEGLPGKRYYGGCQYVDVVEKIAIERACNLFGASYAKVQPHSGAQANTAVYFALLKPGATVMGMALDNGGHLTHGSPVNISGKYFNFVPYGVNDEGFIDYAAFAKQVNKVKPKLIVAGASAYPREIDFQTMADIAHANGAMFMVDMAHIAGLVAAGLHQSPVPCADVVTTTTHKTLRGPRGGLILCNNPYLIKKLNSAVFPGTQGGPLMHIIAAKAVCFGEALKPEFKAYQQRVIDNAKALAKGLTDRGLNLVSGGTDNHLCLLSLIGTDVTGKELEHRLDEVHITLHKNTVPNEPLSPFITSGVRIGTPAATTRGLNTEDMDKIAEYIYLAITDFDNQKENIAAGVAEICKKYPLYAYNFMKILFVYLFQALLQLIYLPLKAFCKVQDQVVYLSRQSNEKSLDMQLLEQAIEEKAPGTRQVFRLQLMEDGFAGKLRYFGHLVGDMKALASSKVVIVDTYSIAVSCLRHKDGVQVVQMWHALGAVKKFGLQSLGTKEGRDAR